MGISRAVRKHMDESSWIRRMFELGISLKEQRGEHNVSDLSLGNPVMDPPGEFYDELRHLVSSPQTGMHRYMPNAGYLDTRQAVAESLAKETGVSYRAENVMMSVGAGGAINVALHALCDPGDEVVILTPFFGEYIFYALNHSAVPIVVACDERFNPDMQDLESKITDKTKAVLLNSPNNPSGAVYSSSVISELADMLNRKSDEYGTEIFIISDEPYRKVIFDGLSYPFPERTYIRTLTVNSHSKDLGLPGERIGYLAVHPDYSGATELMDAIIFCNRVLGFVNAPALMQRAVRVLQEVTIDVDEYRAKRDFLFHELTSLGYEIVKPEGAFYMFPKSPVEDELEFVNALQAQGVLVVPGRGFGLPGYFRISYCVPQEVLERSIHGFRVVASDMGIC